MSDERLEVSIDADIGPFVRGLEEAKAELVKFAAEVEALKIGEKIGLPGGGGSGGSGKGILSKWESSRKGTTIGGLFTGAFGALGSIPLLGAVFRPFQEISKWADKAGVQVEKLGKGIGGFFSELGGNAGVLGSFGSSIATVAPLLGEATAGVLSFGIALLVIPGLIGAVAFAVSFLGVALTTLTAILGAGLIAFAAIMVPIGLFAAGIFIATKRLSELYAESKKKGGWKDIPKDMRPAVHAVHDLIDSFQGLSDAVFHRLAPVFTLALHQITGVIDWFKRELSGKKSFAQIIRDFFNKGREVVPQAIGQWTALIAGPFRKIMHNLFSPGGGADSILSMVDKGWNMLSDYLFGSSKKVNLRAAHGIQLDPGASIVTGKGAVDPLLAWFGRFNFTKIGMRWANEIWDAFEKSGLADKIKNFIEKDAKQAGHVGGKYFMNALQDEIKSWIPRLAKWAWNEFFNPHSTMNTALVKAQDWIVAKIKHFMGEAWDWVKHKATSVWNSIKDYLEGQMEEGWNHLKKQAGDAWSYVKTKAAGAWDAIKQKISGVYNTVKGWITNGIAGAWNKVKSAVDPINNAVTSITNAVKTLVGWIGRIHFPSFPSVPTSWLHLPKFPGTAVGTSSFRGGVTMVGENGPELVSLPRGSAVTPNHYMNSALDSMGGGGGITINVNHSSLHPADPKTLAEIGRVTKDAVAFATGNRGYSPVYNIG